MSFPVYVMALLSFVGWFFFFIFAGVGLSALPIDLLQTYFTRPIIVSEFKRNIENKRKITY